MITTKTVSLYFQPLDPHGSFTKDRGYLYGSESRERKFKDEKPRTTEQWEQFLRKHKINAWIQGVSYTWGEEEQ